MIKYCSPTLQYSTSKLLVQGRHKQKKLLNGLKQLLFRVGGGGNLFKALKCEIVNSKMGNVYAPNKN